MSNTLLGGVIRSVLLLSLVLALDACTIFWGHGADDAKLPLQAMANNDLINLFPDEVKAGESPEGWDKWIIHPLKRKTDYGWKKDKGGVFVEAKSSSSASGLIKRLNLVPADHPWLQFSWMVDNLLEGADAGDRDFEDSPVRVVLAFDGDKTTLSAKDRMFIERVKTFTGQDLPFATLMYIWDNKRSVNSVVVNPHTQRIRKIVASSGVAGIRSWQLHQRNIINDYRLAFGKEPGRLIAVGIMTDTDNTRTSTRARYRGLLLSAHQPVARPGQELLRARSH